MRAVSDLRAFVDLEGIPFDQGQPVAIVDFELRERGDAAPVALEPRQPWPRYRAGRG